MAIDSALAWFSVQLLLKPREDVFTVQELAGHASPATTAKYDRRGEGRKRRAVKRLKFR